VHASKVGAWARYSPTLKPRVTPRELIVKLFACYGQCWAIPKRVHHRWSCGRYGSGVLSAEELRDATCVVCPAQKLALGEFDVAERPEARNRLDREVGYRIDRVHGFPVCAHPFRVGLPPGAYASQRVALPTEEELVPPTPAEADLEVPDDVDDLEAWIIAVLRVAGPDQMASALYEAETIAAERFASGDIVAAMRRVLTVELTR
jgi:hypothetical protein